MTGRPRRLTLHVGQTKAGSTSLQNWLDSRRGALLKQGVLFPSLAQSRKNPSDPQRTSGHLGLLRALGGKVAESSELTTFEDELAEHSSARLVLSIENLFSDHRDAELDRLAAYFKGWQVEILAVLRPQLDWLRSRHVENTMSGFHCATASLPSFAQAAWQTGALDYHDRLRHLAERLGAVWVRALRFDDAKGEALVPRLLAALELAPDAEEQAARIHANRRERDPELLEAKRRLNGLIRGLSVPERLRLENELCQLARETALESASECAEEDGLPAPTLDPVQLAALQAGNDALLAAGILDQQLPVGRPDTAFAPPGLRSIHRTAGRRLDSCRTAALLQAGLGLAARIGWQSADRARLAGTLPGLNQVQIEALCAALRRHPVSLHLQAPASATLAATADRALAVLLNTGPATWKTLARLDALETAGPLVALALPDDGPADLLELLKVHHLPPPGLLVVGADCPTGLAEAALAQLQPQEVFIWAGADFASPLSSSCWGGYAVGSALLARTRVPAPSQTLANSQTEKRRQERAI